MLITDVDGDVLDGLEQDLATIERVFRENGASEFRRAKDESELETALSAVYGYLTLTLKGQEISQETRQSMKQISSFLALLAHRYQMEQTGSDLEPQP